MKSLKVPTQNALLCTRYFLYSNKKAHGSKLLTIKQYTVCKRKLSISLLQRYYCIEFYKLSQHCCFQAAVNSSFRKSLSFSDSVMVVINECQSLLIYASYCISWCVHAQFTSVAFAICKCHWQCRYFLILVILCFIEKLLS